MRRTLILSIVGSLVAGYLWLALSSMIYCTLIGRWDLFVPPFMQWAEVAPDWRATSATTTYFLSAAALPTALVGLVGFMLLRTQWQGQNLFGKTGWANDSEMQTGGFRLKRRP